MKVAAILSSSLLAFALVNVTTEQAKAEFWNSQSYNRSSGSGFTIFSGTESGTINKTEEYSGVTTANTTINGVKQPTVVTPFRQYNSTTESFSRPINNSFTSFPPQKLNLPSLQPFKPFSF